MQMRALLIDSDKKTVSEIEHDGGDESIRKALGCPNYKLDVSLSNGDKLYVDDDRWIDNLPPVACFFLDTDRNPPTAGPNPGPGLIVGADGDAKISVTELTARTRFLWCRYWPDMGGVGLYSDEAEALR
jgi:hypothetical protein